VPRTGYKHLVKHPRTIGPATLKFIDLVNPLKTEYENLVKTQLNKPGGGSLKDFPNWEEFLRKKLNKTVAEVKTITGLVDYHGVRPTVKLVDARKQLLDKLIDLDNKKPGTPTANYKLAEQAGYKPKFKEGRAVGNTAPPGSFKNLKTITQKVLARVDDVIANLENMSVDKIKSEGGIYKYIGKPFGYTTLEAVQTHMRKSPEKYKTARIDLALLQNPNTLGKYANRGLNAGQLLAAYETGKSGPEFGRVVQKGQVAKIMEYAGRHVREGGQLITKLDDNSFVYNNKIFSTEPKTLSLKRALSKRGLQGAKVIDLVAEAHTQPEFKEIYKVFDELKEIEKIKRPHPLTGKMTPLTTLIKEADNIAYPGRKDAWSKSGLSLDHSHPDGIKGQPFKGIRVATRAMNEAAGQFMQPDKTALQPEFGKKAMGYSFKGNIVPSLNKYIDNTITKGVARFGKMEAAKLKAAGLSGQTLAPEIDTKFFQKTTGKGFEPFEKKFTQVRTTGGFRSPTVNEPRISVAENAHRILKAIKENAVSNATTNKYNICSIFGRKRMQQGGAAGPGCARQMEFAFDNAPEETLNKISQSNNPKLKTFAQRALSLFPKLGTPGKIAAGAVAGAATIGALTYNKELGEFVNPLNDDKASQGTLTDWIKDNPVKTVAGTSLGFSAQEIPGAYKKARELGRGRTRSALGITGALKPVLTTFGTPAMTALFEAPFAAKRLEEGESMTEVLTDPMGPALGLSLMETLSQKAGVVRDAPKRTMAEGLRNYFNLSNVGTARPGVTSKILRMGMSPRMIAGASRFLGLPGLALSLGLTGYDAYKNYQNQEGMIYNFFNKDE